MHHAEFVVMCSESSITVYIWGTCLVYRHVGGEFPLRYLHVDGCTHTIYVHVHVAALSTMYVVVFVEHFPPVDGNSLYIHTYKVSVMTEKTTDFYLKRR